MGNTTFYLSQSQKCYHGPDYWIIAYEKYKDWLYAAKQLPAFRIQGSAPLTTPIICVIIIIFIYFYHL